MNKRCDWPGNNSLMVAYHDHEWGVPLHNDRKLFEFLVLDAFQAGLSWSIILSKRNGFEKAFDGFDPVKIAQYTDDDIARLIQDKSIVRNKLKIQATITNARQFLEIQKKHKSFDRYIWQFVHGKPIVNSHSTLKDIQSRSIESDNMSLQLKKDGFKFVGTTICYAFMQAAGMVNDHLVDCFRYKEVSLKK